MPLYIVRWPDLSVSLVKAPDRGMLLLMLDEFMDPSELKIKQYSGPLFLDLELDVKWKPIQSVTPSRDNPIIDSTIFEDLDPILKEVPLRVSFQRAETDMMREMRDEVIKWAFPNVHKFYQSDFDRLGWSDKAVEEELRQALEKEMERFWDR